MKSFYLLAALFISSLYADDINDPFEDLNRAIFNLNESIDGNFLKPVAKGYSKTPKPIKKGVTNFFNNLQEVETSVNQFLQRKPKRAINDISRFIINSTIGIGGFIDVATKMGMPSHDEDFAQTLALWGVPSGPYIMLPALGPSSVRDTISKPFSSFLSVTFHMTENDVNLGLKAIDALETRERLLEVESLINGDRYNFVKDSYVQFMEYEVNDGIDVNDEFLEEMDDFLIDQ
jgi:phospholipid-binding lipoprotein MlaA